MRYLTESLTFGIWSGHNDYMTNNDYQVTVIDREPATYDERDGFGDFANYKEYPLGKIGASSAAEAIELMRFMCPAELESSMKAVLISR